MLVVWDGRVGDGLRWVWFVLRVLLFLGLLKGLDDLVFDGFTF